MILTICLSLIATWAFTLFIAYYLGLNRGIDIGWCQKLDNDIQREKAKRDTRGRFRSVHDPASAPLFAEKDGDFEL